MTFAELRKPLHRFFALAACMAGLTSAHADTGMVLAGADGSSHASYGYVGAVTRLGGDLGQTGLLLKAWADTMRYEYVSAGVPIKARAEGGQLALGYQWLRSDGYATIYLGAATRNTRLPPAIISPRAGRQSGAVAEVDFSQQLSAESRLDAIVSYTEKTRDHWSRARWVRQSGQSMAWGPEVVSQGNSDYSAWRLGAFAGNIALGSNLRLEANAGYAKTRALKGGAYGGLSVVASF